MIEQETLNLQELGEVEYQVLKETYCRLHDVRSGIKAMRDRYAAEGTAPDFDQIEALHMQMEAIFTELERFLLPICSPSSCGPDMCEG